MPAKLARKSLKRRQQVAAVCYRIGMRGIEFLLVQTRGGRWIFPKGGVEPGLTHAQSAALEAFEEAGVHGRIENTAFARYRRGKGETGDARGNSAAEPAVIAHLCEVSHLVPPEESKRNPTWFPVEKAKRRLLQDRSPESGVELTSVVDRALSRIQRLHGSPRSLANPAQKDGLQKVRFEAFEGVQVQYDFAEAAMARCFRFPQDATLAPFVEVAAQAQLRKTRISARGAVPGAVPRPTTEGGSLNDMVRKITSIDGGLAASNEPSNRPANKLKFLAKPGESRPRKSTT